MWEHTGPASTHAKKAINKIAMVFITDVSKNLELEYKK